MMIRRRLPWILLAVTLAGCATTATMEPVRAPVATGPRIYVANESGNSVTVIDANSLNVVGTVDSLNHSTHDIAVTRDGRRVFVTNLASGKVSVIDTEKLETMASIYTGRRSHVVTLTNDNRQAWVANISDDNISVIDTQTLRILGTISVGKGPTGMTFSRDGRLAFVSNQGDRSVQIIDTSSHRVIKSIPVGINPHFLALGPEGHIWGCNTGDEDIFVIDPATMEKVASFKVGREPQQIAFAYRGVSGPNAYVTLSSTNKVAVVSTDLKQMRILDEIDVGQRPNGIWANPEGTRLYVVHEASDDLQVIDSGTGRVVGKVPVGRKPIRVVVSK